MLSCESIVEPVSGIRGLIRKWPYKEAFYWSRYISVASLLKGGVFFAPPVIDLNCMNKVNCYRTTRITIIIGENGSK